METIIGDVDIDSTEIHQATRYSTSDHKDLKHKLNTP